MNNQEIIEKVLDIYYEFQSNLITVDKEELRKALDKIIKEDRIAIRLEKNGEVAFGIARTLTDKYQANLPGLHVEGGSIAYVDFVNVAEKESTSYLMEEMLDRFEGIEQVAFHRKAKSNKELKLYNLNQIKRLTKIIGD